MTIPKENRQQMINLMYLVLTALLALNVSAEILNAFSVINSSLENSNTAMDLNNKGRFAMFDDRIKKEADNEVLVANKIKAEQVAVLAKDLADYVDELINKITEEAGGIDPNTGEIKRRDDIDASTRLLVEGAGAKAAKTTGEGYVLKDKLDDYKAKLVGMFDNPDVKKKIEDVLPISTKPKTDGADWVRETFYQMPAIATKTLLNKIKNDIKSSEGEVVSALMLSTDEEIRINAPVKLDQFSARIVAPTSYVLRGEPFKADLFLAATSSDAGAVKIIANGSQLSVNNEGVATYSGSTAEAGEKTISGYIELTNKVSGKVERHDFEPFKYTVALPFATVSPTKMNVFYIGVDNPIAVSAAGVRSSDLVVSMSPGQITGSGGNYTVRVSSGAANTEVVVKDNKGRSFGSFPFRIKRIPDPIAKCANKPGGTVSAAELKVQRGVIAELENFDFDAKFEVLGYQMVFAARRQDLAIASTSGPLFNTQMQSFLSQAKPGDLVYIEEIRVKGPDGETRKIPGITFKLN
jgi:gliding motility-associated protein GldM